MTYLLPTLLAGQIPDAATLSDPDNQVVSGTYTPTLTASGGTPAIGADGFLTGWYHRVGRLVTVWIDINLAGSGVSIVGTTWRVSLPFDADTSFHTTGVLDAASDQIGVARTRSGTAAQSTNFGVLLSAVAELIFYGPGTNTSMGSADFTTSARIKAVVHYLADAAEF
jgi:hypothetical protein